MSFTHGTSQQRYSWFKRGFDSGNEHNAILLVKAFNFRGRDG
ncbi:neutral zinc metallopeptidase [Escherichia coli]